MVLNLLFVVLFMLMLLILMYFVSNYQNKVMMALNMYECGFSSMSVTRKSFSFRFFLIAILFVVFDIEIILMLSIPYLDMCSSTGVVMFYFLMLLLMGLMYEMKFGVLKWAEVLN